jgi:hypothetical protein
MTRSTEERTKRWHDKRMRKKEYDIGDKVLMNSSTKESFKQEEKTTTTSHVPFIIVSSRSNNKGNILRLSNSTLFAIIKMLYSCSSF